MISIKGERELAIMAKCGQIAATVMEEVIKAAKPGMTKAKLEKIADNKIGKLGGAPSFKTVEGYNWATCITVNSEVVHGIPNDYVLKLGDLVSVDLGVIFEGLHTDMARTFFLGRSNLEIEKFILTGEKALKLAIENAKPGNQIYHISAAIQKTVEQGEYSVVRALVGHGIGYQLHEEPQVPGFVADSRKQELKVGMTLAIEVIYTAGSPDVTVKEDGWTVVSKDGSLGGLFEDTVAIGKTGPVILTKVN